MEELLWTSCSFGDGVPFVVILPQAESAETWELKELVSDAADLVAFGGCQDFGQKVELETVVSLGQGFCD